MNQKITRTEFRESMDRRLSAMKAEPWLAQRIIAAEGGEKTVAKKLSVSMILVIALIAVLATGALAATLGAWGIIDFAGNHYGAYIPPKYEDCIKSENVTAETESLSVNIRESYYDGTLLRVTADVTPKQPVFLLGEGVYPEDPAFDSLPGLESEEITVAQAARERFDGRMAEIVLYTDESTSASGDCRMNDDNSATLYIEEVFDDEQKDRDVTLHLSYIPIRDLPAEAESGEISGEGEEEFDPFDFDRQETVDIPMTFHSAETRTFVCDRPMDFPSVGVQVTKVTIKATPLEILYNIDYAVTDVAKFEAQEGGLWFEFIDPQSTAADPYDQCLVSGLTSIGTARRVDDESEDEAGQPVEVGTAYYQRDSIGLNALSDEYTLRVREFMEENRYESITFRVEEAR
jgi:hypothetical protein